jgi:hypothetical protein
MAQVKRQFCIETSPNWTPGKINDEPVRVIVYHHPGGRIKWNKQQIRCLPSDLFNQN